MKKIKTKADLEVRKEELEERIEKLEAELIKGWTPEKCRDLNILRHHLVVCEQRLNGEWLPENENIPDVTEIPFKR